MHKAMAMVFLNLRPHLTDRSEPRSDNVTAGEREALRGRGMAVTAHSDV